MIQLGTYSSRAFVVTHCREKTSLLNRKSLVFKSILNDRDGMVEKGHGMPEMVNIK